MVSLRPENAADVQWTVNGRTDAEGKATIVTHGQFPGAPAGKFKVCVTKVESVGEDAAEPVGVMSAPLPTSGRPQVVIHVDPVFGDSQKTPLEIEVSKGKGANITLNVHKPK